MKKYYSLIDKIYDKNNILKAFKLVKKNKGAPGIDGETIECFELTLTDKIDEIHCELVYEKKHIPMVTLKDEFINSITLMSPGKTYNLPGIPIAFGVIPDKDLRNQFLKASAGVLPKPGVLNYEVCKAAYSKGEAWRQELLKHLKDNINFLKEEINKRMPALKIGEVEGGYLAWIDARELGIDDPYKFFLKEAKVVFSDGRDFGESGYLRLNFACSREVLEEALDRMENAINKIVKL